MQVKCYRGLEGTEPQNVVLRGIEFSVCISDANGTGPGGDNCLDLVPASHLSPGHIQMDDFQPPLVAFIVGKGAGKQYSL